MKVIVHIELNDEQRNALSVHLNPRAAKRLASRDEVREFVLAKASSLFSGEYAVSTPYHGKGQVEIMAPEPFSKAGSEANEPNPQDPQEYDGVGAEWLKPYLDAVPAGPLVKLEPKTGMGIMMEASERRTGAPQDPVRAGIFHLNTAMFSVATAGQLAKAHTFPASLTKDIEAAHDGVMDARAALVAMSDEEAESEYGG